MVPLCIKMQHAKNEKFWLTKLSSLSVMVNVFLITPKIWVSKVWFSEGVIRGIQNIWFDKLYSHWEMLFGNIYFVIWISLLFCQWCWNLLYIFFLYSSCQTKAYYTFNEGVIEKCIHPHKGGKRPQRGLWGYFQTTWGCEILPTKPWYIKAP